MIGIIGGTGLGDTLGTVGNAQTHDIDTPFGQPSAPILTAEVNGMPVALLSRHGEGHVLNPSSVPYRANIFALKQLGVTRIIASGAVGSLREEIAPRDLVLPDQAIDRTYRRLGTFFEGLAVHVEMAAPFCPALRAALTSAAATVPVKVHLRGTYVCMEGPQFSSRAESEMHRQWGGDLIGMTLMPEAKLAREAEICYASVALSTDYDCWRAHRTDVDQIHLLGGDHRQRPVRDPECLGLDPRRVACHRVAARQRLCLPAGAEAGHLERPAPDPARGARSPGAHDREVPGLAQ